MLIFHRQTGMNLADSQHTLHQAPLASQGPMMAGEFWISGAPKGTGFSLRSFSEYWDFFGRYLEWRDAVFP